MDTKVEIKTSVIWKAKKRRSGARCQETSRGRRTLSGIVLQGCSPDNTIVTGAGSSSFSISTGGTVRTDSDIQTLTVNNTGGNTFAAGIVSVGASGRITDVNVNCSGAANAYGITNALGDVIIRGARVSADATGESVGLVHDLGGLGAETKVSESRPLGSSSGVGRGEGIRSVTASELRVTSSVVEGTAYYMNAQAGSFNIVFRNSALSGAPNGVVADRGTSTASNLFTNTCPTEFWDTSAD